MAGAAAAPLPMLVGVAYRRLAGCSDFVAGTGIVQRYVDSPDAQYRGYDLEITSRVARLAQADQIMFAVAQTPIPGVEPGDEVLVVDR
jgi:hypothetical protein